MQVQNKTSKAAGFSLLELIIAMSVTLVGLLIATTLLAGGFRVRGRENTRSDAIADAQRAINIMSREIGNSGFGLIKNGIVGTDSGINSIRVRANLNAYGRVSGGGGEFDRVADMDEDVKFYIYSSGSTQVIARYDVNTAAVSPLANHVDSLVIRYYAARVNYQTNNCDITASGATEVTPSAAGYVVLTVCVQLPAVGVPQSPGYQPPSRVQLTSDVTLRNASQTKINEY
jgi:prepilin-type N-terminal cleavage/methylation domain-containing protein